ncbi:hypothetical protein H6G00_11835 [Leptolyngbya sp. FACHB-541]|uniref:hypothetical protein n=1 Tax=Leptolyngbya sp. FACHB-541 TaxID=2692810 RepID=UPI001683588E|nr:hypothetical protein [Leptolyngbya sp. FACHB-541]MBD1997310.1 hypothetical protein [Leptolyngbya sp. FACHB-541]
MSEIRWRKTDASDWLQHCPEHESFYLVYGRIYTPGEGYSFSETNNLISNLKASPQQQQRLRYKRLAMEKFAAEVIDLFTDGLKKTSSLVLVPMPPSKAKDHPDYDNRIEVVAQRVAEAFENIVCLPLLVTIESHEGYHTSGASREAEDIYNSIAVDEEITGYYSEGSTFVILDDILTSGAHYAAARRKLLERFSNTEVKGLFWAKSQYMDV